ncbi:hypothetical protein AYO44_01375 [Planctomycetaceae bacterium SCGC AG-212-F19]|nr:hypothetical protein AYO44_01375 [Planctomycetaceae bacterium SCGC AG-212-F19]
MPKDPHQSNVGAVLPGEVELLARVVADLHDDPPKLIYADWLDERGDQRGPFLRAFVRAVRQGAVLPDSAPFSQAWRNLVGVTVIEGAFQHGLADRIDPILHLALPTITFDAESPGRLEFPIGATKLGGCPDLPSVEDWPLRNELPLSFLGQFNLADFKGTLAARDLPESGILTFFLFNDPSAGMPVEDPGYWRCRFIPGGTALVRCPPHPRLDEANRVRSACAVQWMETLDLSPLGNPELEIGDRDLEYGFVEQLLREERQQVFGFEQLLGQTHLPTFVFGEHSYPPPEWQHLVTFQENHHLDWDWGNHGLHFFIRTMDLRKQQFDATGVIVD